MPLVLPHYAALIADPDHPEDPEHATEHQLFILHGDQMRAELEAPRNGIPGMDVAPMHGITLWIWAALMRTHVIDEPFQVFQTRLLAFEDLDPNGNGSLPGGPATPADPTPPAPDAGSPSPSASTGQPSTGSTPTVTTG